MVFCRVLCNNRERYRKSRERKNSAGCGNNGGRTSWKIVEVIVIATRVLLTENEAICRAVKSIDDVLEKKFASSNAVASESVI